LPLPGGDNMLIEPFRHLENPKKKERKKRKFESKNGLFISSDSHVISTQVIVKVPF